MADKLERNHKEFNFSGERTSHFPIFLKIIKIIFYSVIVCFKRFKHSFLICICIFLLSVLESVCMLLVSFGFCSLYLVIEYWKIRAFQMKMLVLWFTIPCRKYGKRADYIRCNFATNK